MGNQSHSSCLVIISVVRTILSVSLHKFIDKNRERHVIVAWIATNAAETTQTTIRQPTFIETTNISTLRQSDAFKTASWCIVNQWLVRRITHCADNAQSIGRPTANFREFTMLHCALWHKFMMLKHVSDSQWRWHSVVVHDDLRC